MARIQKRMLDSIKARAERLLEAQDARNALIAKFDEDHDSVTYDQMFNADRAYAWAKGEFESWIIPQVMLSMIEEITEGRKK